jgi:hypothetical protein
MPNCKACDAEIRFARTESGKTMPVDAESSTDGSLVLYHDEHGALCCRMAVPPADQLRPRHKAHFATCTSPESFRKDRR